jgi:hypothetical protein
VERLLHYLIGLTILILAIIVAYKFGFLGEPEKPLTPDPDYYLGIKINADSLLEKRLAINMLRGETTVELKEFKEIKSFEYLEDRIQKVIYQNPLILGVKGYTYARNIREKTVTISYGDPKPVIEAKQQKIVKRATEILPSIVSTGMTDNQMHKAIYDYLDRNSKYDKTASKYVNLTLDKVADEYRDSFTTYGVLINGVGVCQSYAYSYKLLSDMVGLKSIVVTGNQGGVPHAWNKVYIGDGWLNTDPTNNLTNSNIPYSLFFANDAQSTKQKYTEDKLYTLDKDMPLFDSLGVSNDYYSSNGLEVTNLQEYEYKLAQMVQQDEEIISIRVTNNPGSQTLTDTASKVYNQYASGLTSSVKLYFLYDYVVIRR